MQCHTRILYGGESDTLVDKYISNIKNNSLSLEQELLDCKYSEADVSKLEEEFDKMFKKESEGTVDGKELVKLHNSNYFDSNASVDKLSETPLPNKSVPESKDMLRSDVGTVPTDSSLIDYPQQTELRDNVCIDSRSPKLVKELMHNFEY